MRRNQYNGMVINNAVYYSAPGFLEEGKAAMEGVGLVAKNEVVEGNEECENGCKDETFADLIEEKGQESSSSSEFVSSETGGLEEHCQSIAEDSSSPPSMGSPVQEMDASNCTSPHGSEDAEKKDFGHENFEIQVSVLPGIQCCVFMCIIHV